MTDDINAPAVAPVQETPAPPAIEPERIGGDPPAEEAPAVADTTEAPETVDETAEPDIEEPEERKKPTGSQRLKRRLAAIEGEFAANQHELEELRRRHAPQSQTEGRPGVDREPKEADFPNDYFAYERAQNTWATRQAIRDEINRDRQQAQERSRREMHQDAIEAYEEYAETVRERIPDFDKVIRTGASVNVKQEVIEELLASDKSALLQYHLAKNPDKVRELNGMSGRELAREIGRLEARVHLPTSKKATEASPPPSLPKGGAAPAFDPFKTDDMNAYAAWRKKQMAQA